MMARAARPNRRASGIEAPRAPETHVPTTDSAGLADVQRFMQQGQWHEAEEALASLERRHPGSQAVREMRELLALRLSAEETWAVHRSPGEALEVPAVRALLVANAAVYTLLGILSLVS